MNSITIIGVLLLTIFSSCSCAPVDEIPEYLPNPDGRDELFGYINSRNGLTKRERFAVGALVDLLRNSIPATVGRLVEAVKATPAMERAGFWRQTDISKKTLFGIIMTTLPKSTVDVKVKKGANGLFYRYTKDDHIFPIIEVLIKTEEQLPTDIALAINKLLAMNKRSATDRLSFATRLLFSPSGETEFDNQSKSLTGGLWRKARTVVSDVIGLPGMVRSMAADSKIEYPDGPPKPKTRLRFDN